MAPVITRLLGIVGLLASISPGSISAQCAVGGPSNPPAVPRAIVGIVLDTANVPIEGANVLIRSPRREVRTGSDGLFRINDLSPGSYDLTVRRIGHEIAIRRYIVSDTGGVARFCLIPEPRGLAPMITSARRPGVGGVVADTAYRPLPGAEVRAVAGGVYTTTDTTGGFFLPLKPGNYAILVKKDGYGSQLVSVTVPPDSGRQIAVWLGAPPRNARRVAAALEDSMRFRLMFARPNRDKLLSSEQIMRNPGDLAQTVQNAAIARVDLTCEAIIDGGPFTLPLSLIDKAEIAAMEVYGIAPQRRGVTSIDPRGSSSPRASSSASGPCSVRIYVWLKP